jgi:hypothetical protein
VGGGTSGVLTGGREQIKARGNGNGEEREVLIWNENGVSPLYNRIGLGPDAAASSRLLLSSSSWCRIAIEVTEIFVCFHTEEFGVV